MVHVVAWTVFAVTLGVLLAVDVAFLQTPLSVGRMPFQTAVRLTTFWVVSALVFDVWVWCYMGFSASVGFLQGLLLEYMLSFDNLFVFNLIFAYYCTPEALQYRALYFGIAGAIVLRVVFLSVGWSMMNSGVYFVRLCFGVLLVWSGVKAAGDLDDSEEHDPTKNRFVRWLTDNLPVSDVYEPHGHFFITVPDEEELHVPPRAGSLDSAVSWAEQDRGSAVSRQCSMMSDDGAGPADSPTMADQMTGGLPRLESFEGSSLLDPGRALEPVPGLPRLESFEGSSLLDPGRPMAAAATRSFAGGFDRLRSASLSGPMRRAHVPPGKTKATLLLLVVIAVWAVDLLFAVDSVASKLASVNDIFLNCSSSAFAMLSLRSLYFIVDSLSRSFKLLKYGIAAVLVLIGLKLVVSGWIDIPMQFTFFLMLGIIVMSIASSSYFPSLQDACERVDLGLGDEAGYTGGGLTGHAFDRASLPLAATASTTSAEDEDGVHVIE